MPAGRRSLTRGSQVSKRCKDIDERGAAFAGIKLLRRRTDGTLSPGRKGKLEKLSKTTAWKLTRFAEFASRSGLEPEVVDAGAMELLLMRPMRIGNLARLDLERHLLVSSAEENAEICIRISADEVRNAVDLDFVLPRETAAALQLFRRRFRPLLCKEPSSALFPGRTGQSKALRCWRERSGS
jgi:hypothetical protein